MLSLLLIFQEVGYLFESMVRYIFLGRFEDKGVRGFGLIRIISSLIKTNDVFLSFLHQQLLNLKNFYYVKLKNATISRKFFFIQKLSMYALLLLFN